MLAVQYNRRADTALESELRRLKDELPEENLCYQLEVYLRQGDWRKADEETAWLFYLVMVQQGYKDWSELGEKFILLILETFGGVIKNLLKFFLMKAKQICTMP